MEQTHFLEKAFEDFSSTEESLEIVKKEVKKMLDEDTNLNVGDLTKIVTKLSSQGGGEERLNAISEASEYIISSLMEPKMEYCQSLFFPSKENSEKLMKYLKFADDYCYCAVYTITNDYLSRVLYTLKDRGVDVRVITDDETFKNKGSDIQKLANAGISVRLDPDPQARMHHKFVVLDDELLINGSFNWTTTAVFRNFENVVVMDHQKLIQDFKKEFLKLWDQNEEGELEGNGEVDPTLLEYRNKWKNKHKNYYSGNKSRRKRRNKWSRW